MNATEAEHRTCAILAVDVVGYGRLMAADERATYERLVRLRATEIEPRVVALGGTLIKHTGDGFLIVFDDACSAIACALEIQRAISAAESGEMPNRRISLRIGVNVGDVIVDGGDIYGDAVNIAARLQTYAEPGGIAVTGDVRADRIRPTDPHRGPWQSLSAQHARPVRMFTLHAKAPMSAGGRRATGSGQPTSDRGVAIPQVSEGSGGGIFRRWYRRRHIYALAGLKELFVVSRGSALGYGGDEVDTRAIGQALGVRYVLYGSVRRDAGRLRIATELSDAETGRSSGRTNTRACLTICSRSRTAFRPAWSARSRRMCSSTNWSALGANIHRT